jgi:peptide/nickel transport system permease protein
MRRRPSIPLLLPRKLLHMTLVLLLVSFATLALMDLIPGGPAYAILGESATPAQVTKVNAQLGLDRPLPARYADWLGHAVTGDLGASLIGGRPVTETIGQRLPVTLELAVLALVFAIVVSVPLAVLSAYRRDRPVDRAGNATTVLLMSSPHFLTALALSYVLAIQLRAFPVTGWTDLSGGVGENLRSAFLPALTLAFAEIPILTRVLRADLIETLDEDFVLAARAKGLSAPRVLFGHALRPSSFSLVTLAGLTFGNLIAGTVIVETIFAVPGIGQALVQSVLNKDFPVLQGIVVVIAVAYVVTNVVVDLAYGLLDPRVRASAA